jgi:hypothetical protein
MGISFQKRKRLGFPQALMEGIADSRDIRQTWFRLGYWHRLLSATFLIESLNHILSLFFIPIAWDYTKGTRSQRRS